jgi:ABC-type multidrug transport system ATPase subunit
MSAITPTDLTKRYGALTALHGLDVRTEPGTVLGPPGPGAGESTTDTSRSV